MLPGDLDFVNAHGSSIALCLYVAAFLPANSPAKNPDQRCFFDTWLIVD
jgi:hypothetical protein